MGTMVAHEACEVGQTAPIKVAGRTIGNPLAAVIAYLEEHPGTVRHYDFIAGTSDEVTTKLVRVRLYWSEPIGQAVRAYPSWMRAW